jgi:hypothetical protein
MAILHPTALTHALLVNRAGNAAQDPL